MSRRLDHIHALVSSWEAATASPYPKSHFPGVASTDSTLSVAVERLIEPFCSLQFLRRIHPWAHFPISIGRWAPTSSLGCCSPAVAAAAHNKRALLGPLRLWLIANLGPCNAHVHPPCSRASWWLDERSDWAHQRRLSVRIPVQLNPSTQPPRSQDSQREGRISS